MNAFDNFWLFYIKLDKGHISYSFDINVLKTKLILAMINFFDVAEKMGDNDTEIGGTKPQRIMSCLKTLDIFLQQSDAVLTSMVPAERKKERSQSSLLEAVANVLGIKDVSSVNQNNTLVDMGMDSLMSTEIQQILERNYNIVLTAAQIRTSTFKELRSISN